MKKLYKIGFLLFFIFLYVSPAFAKVDLVTLPKREKVQLTIYNSADLTLIKDERILTLKKGRNNLQFSWANTLIDPTSLELIPLKDTDKIDILDITYPPRVKDLGLWHINSNISENIPIEISYFTSGIFWKAYYLATLSKDEKTMKLDGYVRVSNNSGEDYENAKVRLVVGEIHLLDRIAQLAKRYPPYGRPQIYPKHVTDELKLGYTRAKGLLEAAKAPMMRPKEIKKEGLSEYFLYTIEGTENIPDRWSKRLPSFSQNNIPVVNLYKYEEKRYGNKVIRFLSFVNDKKRNLGKEPFPQGSIKVFKNLDPASHLSYIGADNIKYIPVDEDVELNLGNAKQIIVKVKLMEYKTTHYNFKGHNRSITGNISGWDEEKTYKIKVSNHRSLPVKVEIKRNFPHQYWEIDKKGDFDKYKKIDLDTVKFTLELPAHTTKSFSYKLILHQGDRQQ